MQTNFRSHLSGEIGRTVPAESSHFPSLDYIEFRDSFQLCAERINTETSLWTGGKALVCRSDSWNPTMSVWDSYSCFCALASSGCSGIQTCMGQVPRLA